MRLSVPPWTCTAPFGCGFLESVYHEALAIELTERDMFFRREAALSIAYKGNFLPCSFRVDFICFDKILLELKALAALSAIEDAQVINYLKASKLPLAFS